jgi:hypothetical protein
MAHCGLCQPSANIKLATAFAGLTLPSLAVTAQAGKNPLVGTWKLKSLAMTTAAGERFSPFGEHPQGFLSYSADGRMYAIGTMDGRIAPPEVVPTDAERLELYKTMFAYGGTYSVVGDKVTHYVDISWNEAWTGTDQVRFYALTGNTLTITTARARNVADGQEAVTVMVWEKVAGLQ